MKTKTSFRLIALVLLAATTAPAGAEGLVATLGQLPVIAEAPDKGVLVDLVKAISRVSGVPIEIRVEPFGRSINNVVTGQADFHMPLLEDPSADPATLPFAFSTTRLNQVEFVLYTTKGLAVDMYDLSGLKLETDAAHVTYFPFPITGSTCLPCSLKKVDSGRIDGFIFAALESDIVIEQEDLANIERRHYRLYDGKAVLPKGEAGVRTDALLTEAILALQASGEYDRIMGPMIYRPAD